MCCGGCGSFINPGAYVVAGLKKGDEIILQKDFGTPKTQRDETKIIYEISGYSALCTDGTKLSCHDGNGLTPTGKNLPAKPSFKVYLIKIRIFFCKIWYRIEDIIVNIKNTIWFANYKLKNKLRKNRR
ncbi:MAG TPA: hypothetical protein PLI45_00455 [Candidatus Woesebacteria bacterium]|nr:hypothetical protein [Candidatus Woesebacteria bacterium]